MPKLSKCPGVKWPEKHENMRDWARGFDKALTLADRNVCLDVGKVKSIIKECRLVGMLKHFYVNDEWAELMAQALNERLAEILIEEK